jgi:MYXO-CTERM domain-containing protein
MFSLRVLCFLFMALVGIASRSEASIITVPIGLAAGSQYRLVFITTGLYMATSTSISTYNNDVATEVAGIPQLAALGATWTTIASTEAVSSTSNIGSSPASVGIYLLDGTTLVANGTGVTGTGLFSGSILSPIHIYDNGTTNTGVAVWTGSTPAGTPNTGSALGDALASIGDSSQQTSRWIEVPNELFGTDISVSLYGISSVLTVPSSATPEPGSTVLAALGLGLLLLVPRSRKFRPGHATLTEC